MTHSELCNELLEMPHSRSAVLQQTLDSAIQLFLLECVLKRLRPRTIEFYSSNLDKLVQFCSNNGVTLLVDAARNLRQFNKHLLRLNCSPQYQHNILRAIRAFLRFCVEESLLESYPKITFPKVQRQVKATLNTEEIKKILSVCQERDKLIVNFLLDSGVRANELVTIDASDIDLKSGLVKVREGKTGERFVAIGVQVRKLLVLYLNNRETGPMLTSNQGERLTVNGVMQVMKRLRKRSGIKKLTAHTLRRTYATTSLRQGVSVHVLAKQMGHSTIQMLNRYLNLDTSDLLDMQKKFGVVDNLCEVQL